MATRRVLLVALLIASLSVLTTYAGQPAAADKAPSEEDPPTIAVDRSALNFGAVLGRDPTGAQPVIICATGEGDLNWSASVSQPWLQVDPAAGSGGARVHVSVEPSALGLGDYRGAIMITDPLATNSPYVIDVSLRVMESDVPLLGGFDTPDDGSHVRGAVPITGWVIDDLQVDNVKIYRQSNGSLVYIGDAMLGAVKRPDVEAAYHYYPNNDRAGWGFSMLTNFLPDGGNGSYTLHAVATDSSGRQATLGTRTVVADNAGAVKPFGSIDTPTQGGTVTGSNYINWGWALTPQPNEVPADGSTIDVQVDGVTVGHPVYNVYRADIASLFPGYKNSGGAAGYFSLDTTLYPNGLHTIAWVVTDDDGNTETIGSRHFTIDNPGSAWTCVVPPPAFPYDGSEDVYVDDGFNVFTSGWGVNRFASIQDGIDGAVSPNTVHVAPGSYTESVTLDKNVGVELHGGVVLDGDLSVSTGVFTATDGNLAISGDFTHSGGTFDPNGGMVSFDGVGTQTIGGDTAFWNVTVASGAILETSDDVTVSGTLINLGVTRETRIVSGTESIAFGLADVTIEVTEPGLTGLQVERRDQNHPDAPVGIQTGKYWSFTPTGTDFTVGLTLPHSSVPDYCDKVCRYMGGGLWDCNSDMFDRVRGTITRLGITELSDWATGDDVGPCLLSLPMISRR
jgi:hypothetical protein